MLITMFLQIRPKGYPPMPLPWMLFLASKSIFFIFKLLLIVDVLHCSALCFVSSEELEYEDDDDDETEDKTTKATNNKTVSAQVGC